jgi:hypothetical protein
MDNLHPQPLSPSPLSANSFSTFISSDDTDHILDTVLNVPIVASLVIGTAITISGSPLSHDSHEKSERIS